MHFYDFNSGEKMKISKEKMIEAQCCSCQKRAEGPLEQIYYLFGNLCIDCLEKKLKTMGLPLFQLFNEDFHRLTKQVKFLNALKQMDQILKDEIKIFYPVWCLRSAVEWELVRIGIYLDGGKTSGPLSAMSKIETIQKKYYGENEENVAAASVNCIINHLQIVHKINTKIGELQIPTLKQTIIPQKELENTYDIGFDMVYTQFDQLEKLQKIDIDTLLKQRHETCIKIEQHGIKYRQALAQLYNTVEAICKYHKSDDMGFTVGHCFSYINGSLYGLTDQIDKRKG
ncbi:hypothetical protein OLQ22_08230 [Campylobacter jejuni]|nr:hypothetical protein [Campylobacter jejuni]